MNDPIISDAQADASRVLTAAQGDAALVRTVAVTGFADAHAYAQHIGDAAAAKVAAVVATGRADVAKAESSHTAVVILGIVVGAILGAAGMWVALHG